MMKDFGYYMMILQDGRTMYFGQAIDSIDYFEKIIGYKLPNQMNPIDYYLDIVNDDYMSHCDETLLSSLQIHQKYQQSLEPKVLQEIDTINDQSQQEAALHADVHYNDRINQFSLFFKQCYILTQRNFNNDRRNAGAYWVRIIMYVILCVCIGSMYYKIGTDEKALSDRVSVLFFVVTFWTFLSIAAIPSFLELRSLVFVVSDFEYVSKCRNYQHIEQIYISEKD